MRLKGRDPISAVPGEDVDVLEVMKPLTLAETVVPFMANRGRPYGPLVDLPCLRVDLAVRRVSDVIAPVRVEFALHRTCLNRSP